MKVCSYCHITVSDSDSVCPRDGQSPVEVQPERIDRTLESRFDSIEFFASGSTSDLYLANDSLSQQHGLLKILRSTSSNFAAERVRIKRELLKQTKFSNQVVPVIAIGESGEERAAERVLWIFRQRIDGESLEVYLKREGRLKTSTAIGIAAQIVMGLDTIHRAGLLHRDIKPGHVMLQSHTSGFPQVSLIDTGIPTRIETKTLFDLVGTPHYISPEQIAGKLNTSRSDLYALGCVFYQMLIGRPPFIGKDIDTIFKAHQAEAPPVPDVDLPDPLKSLIASLLAKEPRERPFSAQQVFRALEPFVPSSPLFKSCAISSSVHAPQPVVTNQPTKTVAGIASPASVPPPPPPKSRGSGSSPPIPLSAIKSSVPPPPPPPKVKAIAPSRPPRPKGSVPPPPANKSSLPPGPVGSARSVPPPPANKSSLPPGPIGSARSVPSPPANKSSVSPIAVSTKSSVPPPPVPQGPVAISRDVMPDDFIPITADVSSDTDQQPDSAVPKELDQLLGDISAPQADAAKPRGTENLAATPEGNAGAASRLGIRESSAPGKSDGSDRVSATDTARIKGYTLEKVLSISAQDVPEPQAVAAPVNPESTRPTYRSSRPSVDFQVESLFDDELPQNALRPGVTAPQSYRPGEQPVEMPVDANLRFAGDTQRTAPVRLLGRFDRRLIIGVFGGLVVSIFLLFALSSRESDSDKRIEVNPVPTASSRSPKSNEKRDDAVSAKQPAKPSSAKAAKEELSKEAQPVETVKQDDLDDESSHDNSESEKSSPSKSRKSLSHASSRNTRPDESDSADKLRTEAREHYAAGRYKKATIAYRKITNISPSDAGAFAGLGASYLAQDKARRAITAYKSAIKLDPRNSGFHAALARAYATKGDHDQAIKTYKKALRLNPRNRIAKVALKQLTEK